MQNEFIMRDFARRTQMKTLPYLAAGALVLGLAANVMSGAYAKYFADFRCAYTGESGKPHTDRGVILTHQYAKQDMHDLFEPSWSVNPDLPGYIAVPLEAASFLVNSAWTTGDPLLSVPGRGIGIRLHNMRHHKEKGLERQNLEHIRRHEY